MERHDRELLLETVIPMIHSMAGAFAKKGLVGPDKAIEAQDLIQVGSMAAWNATEKFDKKKGTKFSTYAYIAIERAMLEEIRTLGGPVSIPQQFMHYVIAAVADVMNTMSTKGGHEPTVKDLTKNKKLRQKIREGNPYTTISPQILDAHIQYAIEYLKAQHISLDTLEDFEYDELMDTLPDEREESSPELMAENAGLTDTLSEAMALLPAREEYMLRLRFGLEDGEQYTLREAGRMIGVSQETARKLESRALQTLRRLPGRFELKDWLE